MEKRDDNLFIEFEKKKTQKKIIFFFRLEQFGWTDARQTVTARMWR